MTAAQHEGGAEQTLSIRELDAILEDKPELRDEVLGRVATYFDNRAQAHEQEKRLTYIESMVISHRRSVGPEGGEGNTSNIESYVSMIGESAEGFLYKLAEKGAATHLEEEAREAAAHAYVYLPSFYGDEPDEELLSKAGVDTEELLSSFKEGISEVYSAETAPQILSSIESLEDLVPYIANGGKSWDVFIGNRFRNLEERLKEEGIDLPILGADGLYDYERS